MYQLVYVQDGERPSGPYRLIAVFDEGYAGELGYDDTDYSLLDSFISSIRGGGNRVLGFKKHTLENLPPELPPEGWCESSFVAPTSW